MWLSKNKKKEKVEVSLKKNHLYGLLNKKFNDDLIKEIFNLLVNKQGVIYALRSCENIPKENGSKIIYNDNGIFTIIITDFTIKYCFKLPLNYFKENNENEFYNIWKDEIEAFDIQNVFLSGRRSLLIEPIKNDYRRK